MDVRCRPIRPARWSGRASETIHNACGRAGAIAAHHLFESLGIGAYYLAGSLAVLTFLLVIRREIDQPVLRTVGWVVSVVGLTTLAALAVPNWTPGPVVGAGGYVGAMGRSLLEIAIRPNWRVYLRGQRAAGRACCCQRTISCSAPLW